MDAVFQYTFRDDPVFPVGLVDAKLTKTWPAYDLFKAWGGERRPDDPAPVLTLTGTAIGRTATTLKFAVRRPLRPGSYRFRVEGTATMNVGAPFAALSPTLRIRAA